MIVRKPFIFAVFALLLGASLPMAAAPSSKSGDVRFAISPINAEIGYQLLGYSPMCSPASGLTMEFGLNPGWFINRQAVLGIYFAYSVFFGAGYRDAFLSDARAAYDPIAYPYMDPENALGFMNEGTLDEIDDHRWGISLRLPYPWCPIVKMYWLSRGLILDEGSGDTTIGGVTYVGSGGGSSLGTQGAGLELAMPLAPLNWPVKKWTDWFAFSRVSVFGQWLAFSSSTMDDPRPLLSEYYSPDFIAEYGDLWEFGIRVSIGI